MSGTHGVLPQTNQTGYFYITLEESYVTLFQISAQAWFEKSAKDEEAEKMRDARTSHAVAKAYITDVLVHLSDTIYKQTKSEKNLWVYLSFPQLEARLHGACKMRTLKDAMKELVDDKYVSKQMNRDPRYKSLEYRLNLTKYRKELNQLPKKADKDSSANLHGEIDSAELHDTSANLHGDDANLHDDSAELHARINIDVIQNKYTEEESTALSGESATPSRISDADLLAELQRRGLLPQVQGEPTEVSSPDQRGALSAEPQSAHLVDEQPAKVEDVAQDNSPDLGGVTETSVDAHKTSKDRIAKEATQKRGSTPPKTSVLEITPEAMVIIENWRTIFKKFIPTTPAFVKAAHDLVPCELTLEDLRSIRNYCYENDKAGYYKKRGIKLWDIVREYEGWLSVKEQQAEIERRSKAQEERRNTPSSTAPRQLSALEQHNRDLEQAFKDSSTGPRPPLRMLASSR